MAAPTIVSWTDGSPSWITRSAAAHTASVSWLTGDDIYVVGLTSGGGNTMGDPTATGLTFTSVAAQNGTGPEVYLWRARAAADGTAVTVSATPANGFRAAGIGVLVVRGSDGPGATATNASTARSLSLTRGAASSAVLSIGADLSSVTPALDLWTPTGQVAQFAAVNDSDYGVYVGTWADEGAAGTTAYGMTGTATNTWSKIALEVLGVLDRVYARPSADTTVTGWSDQAGGTSNLYATIDETAVDDADYVKATS